MEARLATDDGELAVVERGEASAPTVVLVHGYPDRAALWDEVADDLAADHHVVAYDVRGAGASHRPVERSAYALPRLLDDLAAVIDATGGGPVHLVGHDWGAIQGFAAVASASLRPRLASFLAVSAPGLDVVREWVADRLARRDPVAIAQLAGQAARSWYVAAFQLPLVPETLVRVGVPAAILRRSGHPAPSPSLSEDAVRGIELYRANRGAGDPAGGAVLPVDLPVRVLTGRRDPFVSPRVFDVLRDRHGVPVTEVDAGHWLPRTHPRLVAGHVRELVAAAGG